MSDQAMKLFEALSDVDEELLERCNHEKNNQIAYMPLWKYKRAMTACLCLLVVGALSWSGYQLMDGRKGSSGSGSESAAPAQIQDMAVPMDTAAGASEEDLVAGGENTSQITSPEEAEAEGVGDLQNQINNGSGSSAGGPLSDSGGINDSERLIPDGITSEKQELQKEMTQKETAHDFLDSREEIPWDMACATEPFGSYLPTVIPAGYEPFFARQSSMPDEWNNMIFEWENGEQIISLNMTVGEAKDNDEIKADIEKSDGLYQYPAKDFKKEMIPEPLEGRIMFTLYYSDGMRIDFAGSITEDEMWELVESIPK